LKLGELILLFLSEKPDMNLSAEEKYTSENSLALLKKTFPHFQKNISGKKMVDFGCGNGHQTVALAKSGAEYVFGVDTNPRCLENACKLVNCSKYSCIVTVVDKIEKSLRGTFDIVISQNGFEHFNDPIDVLDNMKELLKPGGKIYITFGPPWYAPYGAHMHFFTKIPWVNILFSEKTIMSVRSRFRNDKAKKFEEVEGGLNKMSVAKFNNLINKSGLKIDYLAYNCIKGKNFLAKIPIIKEFFINKISCILTKK
jgi:SAM-dependent methyltransferase